MKLTLLLFLISACAFAQSNTDTIKPLPDFKIYNNECNCPLFKPGDRFPDNHPNAKYLNDTTLWEWREVDFGYGVKQKVYNLKPQYKDTIIRNDGTPFEVPVWMKDPHWKKPQPVDSIQLRKKPTIF